MNGEGQLFARDYFGDRDQDIIESVSHTHVLINDGTGVFRIKEYTAFPEVDSSGMGLWPVKIDGKWNFDFISDWTMYLTGSYTISFYQILNKKDLFLSARRGALVRILS